MIFSPGVLHVPFIRSALAVKAGGMSEFSLAERVGIEPSVPLPGQQFSRLPRCANAQ